MPYNFFKLKLRFFFRTLVEELTIDSYLIATTNCGGWKVTPEQAIDRIEGNYFALEGLDCVFQVMINNAVGLF